jgi:hypothetical protein
MTNRTLAARLSRLDGGPVHTRQRADRAAWWGLRGTLHSGWPEEALEAFTRSGDAGDPEVSAEFGRMSDGDLQWSICWLLKRAELWTPEMETGSVAS